MPLLGTKCDSDGGTGRQSGSVDDLRRRWYLDRSQARCVVLAMEGIPMSSLVSVLLIHH